MIRIITIAVLAIPAILIGILAMRNLKRKNHQIVYLSGKVSGLWRWWVILKFGICELWFRSMGMDVYNPVNHVLKDATWEQSMNICLPALEYCEFIFFQFDWKWSPGAIIEFDEAKKQGKILLNAGRKINRMYYSEIINQKNYYGQII